MFAIEAKKKPRLFSPIRLSDSINTYRPEYLPSISADEELLVFSRMIDRQEDLYYSQWNKDHWSRAQPLEGVNTEKYNEAGHCVSADGKTIVFTGCNMPGGLGSCDLYISYFKNGRWTQPANLDSPINTPGWESQPSLSADGNVLYFSSERPGGYGLRDIWHTEKSASGRWSTPKNIGAPINTTRNDSSPFIHADNQTLYFMSDGLPGMGGTDLFFSKRIDTEHWDVPINLGYPINTIGNEGALVVNIDGDKAYYTSTGAKSLQDKDGLENTDIYSFELDKEIRPQSVSFFKALVLDATSSKPIVSGVKITDIQKNLSFIMVIPLTMEQHWSSCPKVINMEYRFLPKGTSLFLNP
ncbi:MAG: PD40 domain-containing protein [Saprospiraceae bacterium]|nr:PD40 domain-containing protein [Candidatus Brachybacter algidus]